VFATGYGTVAALSPAKSDNGRSAINDTMQQLLIDNGQAMLFEPTEHNITGLEYSISDIT